LSFLYINTGQSLILSLFKMQTRKITILIAILIGTGLAQADCSVGATSVSFGAYDVFSGAPNNNGIGTITLSCHGVGPSRIVTLSSGNSSDYTSRYMNNQILSGHIIYNLYTNSARTLIWGDGSGSSSTVHVSDSVFTTLSIYGEIPANQDVSVGYYTDSITVAIHF